MFWKHNVGSVSQIDTILDKKDVTLAEVLEEENIIQECKSQNKKLVDFLTQNQILSQLLDLILQEPGEGLDEKSRYKLPNIASELITCDVPQMNEKLASDVSHLDKLYSFLNTEDNLNPLLTSFFSKAFGVLITRKPEQNWYSFQITCVQVITYIKSKPDFTELLLRHVHVSAVMDLLLRLITCVEPAENKKTVLDWLNEERLIEKVINLFRVQKPKEKPIEGEVKEPEGEAEAGAAAPVEEKEAKEGEESEEGEGGGDEPMSVEEEPPPPPPDTTPPPPPEHTPSAIVYPEGDIERDAHDNAGQLLVEIIRVSRDSQLTSSERCQNALLATAESKATVEMLLDVMLGDEAPARESVVVNCVTVLLALLEVRRPAPHQDGLNAFHYNTTSDQENFPNQADIDRQQKVVEQTVESLVPRLPALARLLANPPPLSPISTTAGLLDPPLGPTRLSVCRLISSLLTSQLAEVNLAVASTDILQHLLNLFFKYSLNNFLHTQVESCIKSILDWKVKQADPNSTLETKQTGQEGSDETLQTPKVLLDEEGSPSKELPGSLGVLENPLLVQLIVETRFVERLVSAWEQEDQNNVAYMGHVLRLTNNLVEALEEKAEGEGVETNPNRLLLLQLMARIPEEVATRWETIVTTRLPVENKRNEIISPRDDRRNNSSDDDADFRDIQFPQDTALHQMFSDYQMQQMSENFIDTFGFNDEFNDGEDSSSVGMRKLSPAVNFLMATDDNTKQAIFDSVCEKKIPGFGSTPDDEDEDDDDPWADRTTELVFRRAKDGDRSNNSSDEEDEDGNNKMEIDNEPDPWAVLDTNDPPSSSVPVAMDTSAPWGGDSAADPLDASKAVVAAGEGGWAQFESAAPSPTVGDAAAEGNGWADFGGGTAASAESSGGGGSAAGFANFAAFDQEGGERKDDAWSPGMSSSPQPTMLDCASSPPGGEDAASPPPGSGAAGDQEGSSSPLGQICRPESPDLSDSNANLPPSSPLAATPTPAEEQAVEDGVEAEPAEASSKPEESESPSGEETEAVAAAADVKEAESESPTATEEAKSPTDESAKENPPP